jgi:hypothetical protein
MITLNATVPVAAAGPAVPVHGGARFVPRGG